MSARKKTKLDIVVSKKGRVGQGGEAQMTVGGKGPRRGELLIQGKENENSTLKEK